VANRYRSLQQLYRWLCEDEEEIDRSPFDRMRPPVIPEKHVEVIDVDAMRRLLAACKAPKGSPAADRFLAVRDEALIRLIYDTGGRCAEVMGLTVDAVDMDMEVIHVHGKGRRDRSIPFGAKAGTALDRYLRARAKHPHARLDALWLAQKGALTEWGLWQMLDRRAEAAGLGHIHPHQLRHSSVDAFLSAGGQETDAMRLFGWRSRQMVARYASATGVRRAHQAKRALSPGDKV
jgi:site-specific recombinase XerD